MIAFESLLRAAERARRGKRFRPSAARFFLPPAFLQVVGRVEVRLQDTEFKVVKTQSATLETFGPKDAGCAPLAVG